MTGRLVDPFNPTIEDVIPHAFIHSISILNRFTGQSAYPYSVGQHTLNLIRLSPMHLKRAALVHDWSEAWFNDLASPVKKEFPDYKYHEKKAEAFITGVMGVSHADLEEFDPFDKRIYCNERNAVFDRITERGMGDDLRGFTQARKEWFEETPWRTIRQNLWWQFQDLFPEWSDRYEYDPFSEGL